MNNLNSIVTKKKESRKISFDDFDEIVNPPKEKVDFDHILDSVISRRQALKVVSITGATAGLFAFMHATPFSFSSAQAKEFTLNFNEIPANSLDTISVPDNFKWQTLVSWGDPLWSKGKEFDHKTSGNAESQLLSFGDNNDGMFLFEHKGKMILAVNNEYANNDLLHPTNASKKPETLDDVNKNKYAHGVSIVEIENKSGKWSIVKDSVYNRRITAETNIELTGPARGSVYLKTDMDLSGSKVKGTFNNCASGKTPWGTYLTCEENFNAYFMSSDANEKITPEFKRYGISAKDWGYGWGKYDDRFDISKVPNEANRHGYVVEIDPTQPNSIPKKRTALGRFKHENAEVVLTKDNRIVVYMGDDERGEFVYKFIADKKFDPQGDNSNLLEDGTLYAGKFNDDGSGNWMILDEKSTGMKKAEICVYTRQAASKVNATTMDRPEWVASHPLKPEIYLALTNNSNRGKSDAMPVNAANPRAENKYGQIIRWMPENNDHTSNNFKWEIFLLAGNPKVHTNANAGSKNITIQNMFNSPDGIGFDSKGGLWIQTDGNYSNKGDFEGQGNNMMLYADPNSKKVKRFLVGPIACEITGLCFSPDKKTMFVGVQHPGEDGNESHFPEGGNARPRSSVVAISMKDNQAFL
jgi:secreted PhoX family phosphatase